MITQLQRIKVARRIAVGLLFVFMAMIAIAQDTPSGSGWNEKPATSIENDGGGDGKSAEKAIRIKDAAELAYFAKQVNSRDEIKLNKPDNSFISHNGTGGTGFSGYYFALSADIDLKAWEWTPIGNRNQPFCGHFDGDGHVVKGLKMDINDPSSYFVYAGLFGHTLSGEIRNLGVRLAKEGIKVESNGGAYVGGIVGYAGNAGNNATIRNCYVDAEEGGKIIIVKAANGQSGGIAGFLSGTITHCYSTVDIEANIVVPSDRESPLNIGGIAGLIDSGTISHCYATGSVIGKGEVEGVGVGVGKANLSVGGICGINGDGTVKNNLALNKELHGETNEGKCYVNRIVGENRKATTNNYANPEMTLYSNPKSGTTANNEDGVDTSLDKFEKDLKDIEDSEWEKAWVWPDGKLPQLQMVTGANGALSYSEWTNSPQPKLPVGNHIGVIKIENGDDGTSWEKAIEISNSSELAYLAKQVNAGGSLTVKGQTITNNGGFPNIHFILTDNIDLSAYNWTPIGNSDHPFCGHFDGKGHVVNGLKIKMDVKDGDESTWTLAGLFGYVVNGTLQNIGVELADEGIEVSAEQGGVFVGGIVGKIDCFNGTAILRHCYVTGGNKAKIKITEAGIDAFAGGIDAFAGGIAGWGSITTGNLTLTHCYATVDVESNATGDSYAGGIAGYLPNASYCFATGNVKAKTYSGGICGTSTVSNSLALNPEIEGNGWINRITTVSSTSNYASPQTKIKGNTITSTNLDSQDGADTWLETFKDDLLNAPGGDGWSKEKGWVWPESSSTQLPKLMVYNGDNGDKPYSDWPGQPDINATDYLSNQPDPDPKPDPEPDPDPVYPPPTPIYYTVTLPQVEGATTDPEAGIHEVESWNTFRFYLTLDPDYSDSQPIVTTSRGETLVPRQSDGAYLVKYVRSDVEISIDSIRPNLPPVANEAIDAPANRPRIWTEASTLCIGMPPMAPASTVVNVITADGRLLQSFNASPGLNRRQLPRGFYIIRISDLAWKVIIR